MGIVNVKSITAGWSNLLFNNNEALKALAQKRAEVCTTCVAAKHVAGIPYCIKCHCPLAAKTQSPYEECPLGKWEE